MAKKLPEQEKKQGKGSFFQTPQGKRVILILGVALVLFILVVGALSFYLFIELPKGPKKPAAKAPTQKAPPKTEPQKKEEEEKPPAVPSLEPVPTPAVEPSPEEAFAAYEYKDPFQPLIGAVAPAPGEAPTEEEKKKISLEDIFTEGGVKYASIKYGGVIYKVKEGDIVDESPYQVLSIGATTVTLLYGDEQITLSIGQVLK